jgi:hypothetical protein|tara:strand:+ start:982 stop:1149 length:168 start_codon:yes stop_codon:yes gene_type:complete
MNTYEIQVTVQHGYKYIVEAEDAEQAVDKYYEWEGVREIRNELIDEIIDSVEEVE